jgi:hypothetical protein
MIPVCRPFHGLGGVIYCFVPHVPQGFTWATIMASAFAH